MSRRKPAVDVKPLEAPNGVRVLFTLPVVYEINSTLLSLNGQLVSSEGSTWVELPPDSVLFSNPPLVTDDIEFEVVPV